MRRAIAVALVVLAGCGGSGGGGDAAAVRACKSFRAMAEEVSKGLLSYAEQRDLAQKVYADAKDADDIYVELEARLLLAGYTAVDGEKVATSMGALASACKPHLS